jgi:transcription elongation factor Elf1
MKNATTKKAATTTTKKKDKVLALSCKCGDCSHWELLQLDNYNQKLKCVSCGESHPFTFNIDPHENLHYVKV